MNDFPTLALPSFDHRLSEIEGKKSIFDIIRRKYLVLTPEEWVRQHFVHLLINHFHYSKNLMKLEGGLTYQQLQKRSDILVYDNSGKPFLLVECKATSVKIDEFVSKQVSIYNRSIKAPFFAVTNGLSTFCFSYDAEKESVSQIKELPPAP